MGGGGLVEVVIFFRWKTAVSSRGGGRQWSPGWWRGWFVTACYYPREKDAGGEGREGEDEEGECAFSSAAGPCFFDFLRTHVRVFGEEALGVDFADVGCDVEEEGEPADPSEELNVADLLDLRRESAHGVVEVAEEGEDAGFFFVWDAF